MSFLIFLYYTCFTNASSYRCTSFCYFAWIYTQTCVSQWCSLAHTTTEIQGLRHVQNITLEWYHMQYLLMYLCKYPHLLSTSDNFCYSIFFIVVRRKFRQRSKKVCFLPHIFCTVSFRILLFQTPSNLCVIFSLIKKKMQHKKLLPLRLELRTKAS